MKKAAAIFNLFLFFLSFLVISSLSSCKCVESNKVKDNQLTAKQSWLFAQTADSGTIKYNEPDDSYTVTLFGAAPVIVKFTDTPARLTSTVKTAEFVKHWKKMFPKNNPNAAFVAVIETPQGRIEEAGVCTIFDVQYDETLEKMTYKVKELPDTESLIVDKKGKPVSKIPDKFGPIAIFIDSATAPETKEFFSVNIVNSANNPAVTDDDIYILVKGINPETQKHCYVKFNNGSFDSLADVTGEPDTESKDYSYKLSSFTNPYRTLSIPYMDSGRIYISLVHPMILHLAPDAKTHQLTITDPDPFKPTDPNYHTIYDKAEVTFNTHGTWFNTTAVDFFCMPLRITQYNDADGADVTVGITNPRKDILAQFELDFKNSHAPDEWNKLFLLHKDLETDNTTVLRVVAPNKAIYKPNPKIEFNPDYLKDYIDSVWTYHGDHKISIDCSELGKGTFSGDVKDIGKGHWTFHNKEIGESYKLGSSAVPKPTSNEVFGGDGPHGTPFHAKNNTVEAVLVKYLSSAMNVGLLPVDGVTLSKGYFEDKKGNFFTNTWCNVYSKALHSFGDKVYAFAYDDVLGMDSTIHQSKPPYSATLTIGDMKDISIPVIDIDSTIYTVNLITPPDVEVEINDKKYPRKQANTIGDVESPFDMTLIRTDGVKETVKVYLGLGRISTNKIGIVIDKTSEDHVNLIIPNGW